MWKFWVESLRWSSVEASLLADSEEEREAPMQMLLKSCLQTTTKPFPYAGFSFSLKELVASWFFFLIVSKSCCNRWLMLVAATGTATHLALPSECSKTPRLPRMLCWRAVAAFWSIFTASSVLIQLPCAEQSFELVQGDAGCRGVIEKWFVTSSGVTGFWSLGKRTGKT